MTTEGDTVEPHERHPRQQLHERVEHDLTLHPPKDSTVAVRMDRVRQQMKHTAHQIIDLCPPGRELSMALTDLEDACQHAIAAIARNQDDAGA